MVRKKVRKQVRKCESCETKTTNTFLSVVNQNGGKDVCVYIFCWKCSRRPGRRKAAYRWHKFKNRRWLNEEEIKAEESVQVKSPKDNVDTAVEEKIIEELMRLKSSSKQSSEENGYQPERLGDIALKAISKGMIEKAPFLDAENIGQKLIGPLRELIIRSFLDLQGIKPGKFRSTLERFAWSEAGIDKMHFCNVNMKSTELEALEYFSQAGKIEEMNVSWNRFGDNGAKALAGIIKHDNIKRINASWNNIGPVGALYIAIPLKVSESVVDLNLGSNRIGTNGAIEIAKALHKNKSLERLNLSFNDIRARGAKALAEALRENDVLSYLNVRSNELGREGAEYIGSALARNHSLKEIIVIDNHIGPEGAAAIAMFFKGSLKSMIKCIQGPID